MAGFAFFVSMCVLMGYVQVIDAIIGMKLGLTQCAARMTRIMQNDNDVHENVSY